MVVDGYGASTNDRFENDVAFFAGAHDFSGVGRASSGHWATLVSNNVFVSAGHFHPGVGSTITFHHTNDPLGVTTTRTVSGGMGLPGGDVWVGWLNAPVGAGVTYYDIPDASSVDLAEFLATDVAGSAILTVGRSPGGNKSGVALTDFVVGQNVVDGFGTGVVTGGITNDVIQWVQDEDGDTDKVLYESKVASGDSGAPSFYVNGSGVIELVGVHFSSNGVLKDGKIRSASRDTYLPNYVTGIQEQVALHAVVVPEPSVAMLWIGALVAFVRLRVRS